MPRAAWGQKKGVTLPKPINSLRVLEGHSFFSFVVVVLFCFSSGRLGFSALPAGLSPFSSFLGGETELARGGLSGIGYVGGA